MKTSTESAPGEARHPGTSVQDLLRADSRPVPEYLREQSYRFLGSEDVAYERYLSRDFFQLELERMWNRTWQWACREEHLPAPGDYVVHDIGPYSIIVVRTESGDIKAFRNACMHRGTKLKRSYSDGHSSEIRCPYHGWTWDLQGRLKSYPCEWDFPHVDPARFGLGAVRVGLWGGFVFINLDPNAMPLDEYLAPLPEHVNSKVFEDRYVAIHVQKELNCNWKVASEAFLEAYHVMETHPQLSRTSGDANTQYDFYGDRVNRLINVAGIPGAYMTEPMTEQQILDNFLIGDRGDVSEPLRVPPGGTARKVMAQYFRDNFGTDLAKTCDSEIVDSIAYFVFPNQQFFAGVSFPIVYRFRPIGMAVDRSLFDLVILKSRPRDGSSFETAQPVRLRSDESYTTVPGMDPYIGNVYDQDTGNMEAAQEGFMTSAKPGGTLGNYQEIRIRHMHRTLEKYLYDNAGTPQVRGE
jgi:phenylpropionate dioxygenase-like ring-hydroxylating dioxygenase large terminal subunit